MVCPEETKPRGRPISSCAATRIRSSSFVKSSKRGAMPTIARLTAKGTDGPGMPSGFARSPPPTCSGDTSPFSAASTMTPQKKTNAVYTKNKSSR